MLVMLVLTGAAIGFLVAGFTGAAVGVLVAIGAPVIVLVLANEMGDGRAEERRRLLMLARLRETPEQRHQRRRRTITKLLVFPVCVGLLIAVVTWAMTGSAHPGWVLMAWLWVFFRMRRKEQNRLVEAERNRDDRPRGFTAYQCKSCLGWHSFEASSDTGFDSLCSRCRARIAIER